MTLSSSIVEARRRGLAVVAVLGLCLPASAFASVFEMFGAGPRAVSMAGAMTAAANGGEAAFHNPAMLSSARIAGAWFGIDTTHNALDVQLSRPSCTDDYLACRAQHINGFAFRKPQLPKDSSGLAMGWHYPIGGFFRNRVALGASLALPIGRLIRISGPDPQTPNFSQYEGMPDRIAFLFAASARVTDWWWVGIGTQVLAVLNARIALGLDAPNNTMDHASIAIGLEPRARLTAGTTLHPMPDLWLALSYRQRLSLNYQIPTSVAIGKPVDIEIGLGHETLFSPDSLHFGLAWRTPDKKLLLSGDMTLAMWSQTPDPTPQVKLDVGGSTVRAMGMGSALDVGTQTAPLDLHYVNTWTPALGVEYHATPLVTVRSGYLFRPSPAPRATGPTNYLDNDAHGIGAGLGFVFGRFSDEVQERLGDGDQGTAAPAPFHVDIGAQVLLLVRRTVYKTDPNDPVGDLTHGGSVWHIGTVFGGSF